MILAGQAYDYDCSWEILLTFDEQFMIDYFNSHRAGNQKEVDTMRGLTIYGDKTIWLLRGYELDRPKHGLGCTIIWHEILHAYGYEHGEMKMCDWKPKQKPNSWSVIIP
jgi:hypothetical protein